VGEDHEERARHVERRRAEIDASISTLDAKWIQQFEADIDDDTRFERSVLLRAWAIALFVFFLTLVRRLYV
jgi:hypothetical protein